MTSPQALTLPVAVIGNGAAAAEAILALRANSYQGQIHLFADNDHPPYNPMLGTYLVAGVIGPERAFPFGDEHSFYRANKVDTHLREPAVRLDPSSQVLTTATGSEYRYTRCLVATGARPSVPPISGLREALAQPDGRLVFTIQSFEDAIDLKKTVERLLARQDAPRAAVIGASFAGVKVAAVLHELGLQVCLVEREPHILPLAAHPDAARIMEAHLLESGYELRLGAALARIRMKEESVELDFGALPRAADPGGAGGTACVESPTQEDVHLVVVCTGSRPALSFLTPGAVDVGDGILVDGQMRSSIPTLYAAGDVAQGRNVLTGRHEIIGLWSSARHQGRAAGRSLAGAPTEYRGSVPHNITHVGRMLFASMGCLNDYDRMVTCSEGDTLQLRVWRDGRPAGINLLNRCLGAGITKQALLRAATGAVSETEATWISLSA